MEVRDGTTWLAIPGLNDWTVSGGEREGRSTTSDSGDPTGLASAKSAPQIEVSCYGVPAHRAWDVILEAFQSNSELRYRQTTAAQTLIAQTSGSNNVAITTAGACTFTGQQPTADDLREGAVIRAGSGPDDYPILTVNPSTLATVVNPAPDSAVAAGNYSIRIPAFRREFAAKALATPDLHGGMAQGGELSGALRLQLRGAMPEWAMQAP